MKGRLGIAVVAAFGLAVGCGNPFTGSSGSMSCDINNGSGHTCFDYTWVGEPDGYQTTLDATCKSGQGGSIVNSCSHAGAVGACETSMGSCGTSYTSTNWFYSGMAATLMQSCTGTNKTWVNP